MLSGPQGWFERVRKISFPPRFDPRALQPVAKWNSHYFWNTAYKKVVDKKGFGKYLFKIACEYGTKSVQQSNYNMLEIVGV